ncbi:nuclear receptor-interacting protein 2 [Alosa pseudoharengus]|uniref:nuclear receptor-interacting protein 2 n=1 Tax=Alosa pseudoharengus TaxID=34774 RepID=UPI003F8BC866
MSETKKRELDMRDKAILHQQRRLKQATQFTHKDSADLLPLDGLKRLGTSKDLQPHSIVQRRLLEGNIPRIRADALDAAARVRSPLADSKEPGGGGSGVSTETEERSESTADDSTEERESPEESEKSLRSEEEEEDEEEEEEDEEDDDQERRRGKAGTQQTRPGRKGGSEKAEERKKKDGMEERETSCLAALVVQCKCHDADVKVSINTGCQHNHISRSCCRRLGLKPTAEGPAAVQAEGQQVRVLEAPAAGSVVGGLQLQLGGDRVQCSAQVTDDEAFELCLGLQTMLELKCCVDLDSRVLRLQASGDELPFLDTSAHHSQCHHDNNKNL